MKVVSSANGAILLPHVDSEEWYLCSLNLCGFCMLIFLPWEWTRGAEWTSLTYTSRNFKVICQETTVYRRRFHVFVYDRELYPDNSTKIKYLQDFGYKVPLNWIKSFSKSINRSMPGSFSIFVYSIMSFNNLIFWQIYLPFTKPV